MLQIFLETKMEMNAIKKEIAVLLRKMELMPRIKNAETYDSYVRAIAGCTHGIYTGAETILKRLIKHFDKDMPTGEDWHKRLLFCALNENPNIRPPIISQSTYDVLNELRGFRHIFRGSYHTNLDPRRVILRAKDTVRVIKMLESDLEMFAKAIDVAVMPAKGSTEP